MEDMPEWDPKQIKTVSYAQCCPRVIANVIEVSDGIQESHST